MADETVKPPAEKLTPLSALNAVGRYLKQPEKSHAITLALGALAAKSTYTKAAIALVCALLGIQ